MPRRTHPEQVARALRAYDERNRPAIAPLAREFHVPYETLRIRIRQRSSEPARFWTLPEPQGDLHGDLHGQLRGQLCDAFQEQIHGPFQNLLRGMLQHRLQGELQREHPQPAGEIIPAQDSNMTPSIDSMSPISSPDPLPPPSLHPDNGIFKLLEGRPLDVCERWIRECIETLPESFKETVRNPPGKTTREFEESNEGSEKLAALPFLDARALLSSVDTPERTFPSPGSDEPSEAVSYKDIVRISDLISKLHTDMHKDIAKMQRDLRVQLDLQDRIMKKSMQMSHLYSVVSPLLSGYGNILKNIEWKTPGESESGDPEPGELRMKQEPVEPSLDHQPPNTA